MTMANDLEKAASGPLDSTLIPTNSHHVRHSRPTTDDNGTVFEKEADMQGRSQLDVGNDSGDSSDMATLDENEERLRRGGAAALGGLGGAKESADLEAAAGTAAAPEPGHAPNDKDPFEVAWKGDDDPECPRSMGILRKWLITVIVCCGSLCVTCGSSIYTSTFGQMDPEFHSSHIVATLGLSTFVLGIALGPAWSPLSEFYGRRPIYLGSFFLFTVWIVPSAVAKNMQTMIVARFFQGFTGSAFLSVAGGTVGDLFTRENMQWPMAVFSMAPFVGPAMGPLVGGFINTNTSWRWTHYVMLIWAFCLFVVILFLVPETYHPVLLRNKARKLRKDTGDDRWHAPIEKTNKSLAKTIGLALLRPFELLVYEPMCLCLDLYTALLLGVLYLFFGAFPLVFETNHGFRLWQVGLTFLSLFVGCLVAGMTTPIWTKIRLRLIAQRSPPGSEPEFRLPSTMLGTIFVPIGLFWFGWATYASVHWIVPLFGAAFFAFGMLLSFNGIFTFFVDTYTLYAASALAGNAFVRCIFAAAFPLFGIQMYEKLGFQWATSLLAFLTLAMLPFPFLFFKFGKRLRGKSRFAVKV